MWNASADADEMRALIDVIGRHGDAIGRDPGEIEKTVMLPLAYGAAPERQQFVCNLIAGMRQTSPALARKSIMIGDKQECLDTIERYARAGVTHFIFMTFAPYMLDEIQGFAEDVIPAARGA
jgi:alkanesulfonate monooxygenase SsuD/methylene tetrahydromethanopterin reductase-like flavin-dependent oxidoreductase (luciferase family)